MRATRQGPAGSCQVKKWDVSAKKLDVSRLRGRVSGSRRRVSRFAGPYGMKRAGRSRTPTLWPFYLVIFTNYAYGFAVTERAPLPLHGYPTS